MSLADQVLGELLRRGERALLRGSGRAIQTSFAGADSAYWRLDYGQRQHCHARFASAERAGAVTLVWARQGGEDRPLERVRLRDAVRLATFLGITSASDAVRAAQAVLAPWLPACPRVAELLTSAST